MKALEMAPCKDMFIYLMTVDNKRGLLLQMTHDRCNSDKDAFEDYKSAKVAAETGENNDYVAYKIQKGKCKGTKVPGPGKSKEATFWQRPSAPPGPDNGPESCGWVFPRGL
jgi:hypothetical protein